MRLLRSVHFSDLVNDQLCKPFVANFNKIQFRYGFQYFELTKMIDFFRKY